MAATPELPRNCCDLGELTVYLVELCCDLAAEQPASTPRADSPGVDVLRVAPHQVAEGAFMRNLAYTVDGANLGKQVQA